MCFKKNCAYRLRPGSIHFLQRRMNKTEETTQGCDASLQSVPVYITSLSSSLTHISCYSKDREQIQQEDIMYLDWAVLHWCFSLLCLMGAPGLPGLVGQMGSEVPGPIWVLNGLSPVCLPSFRSHVTWPCSERSPDCTVQGVHIRCVLTSLPTTNTAHATSSVSLTQQVEQVQLYWGVESDSAVYSLSSCCLFSFHYILWVWLCKCRIIWSHLCMYSWGKHIWTNFDWENVNCFWQICFRSIQSEFT